MTDSTQDKTIFNNEDVFVTYAWDNENPTHQEYVEGFVNRLRLEGVNATMDLLMSQEETAIHFPRMMHQGIGYSKVIIFMSRKYREKANSFTGGVGNEYQLIITDIDRQPRKYILVSTYGHDDDVVSRSFQGREVVSLSDPIQPSELNRILHKIRDTVGRPFVDVVRPPASSDPVPPRVLQIADIIEVPPILIHEPHVECTGAMSHGRINYVNYAFEISIQNQSTATLSDLVLEITLPKELTELRRAANSSFRQDGSSSYLRYSFNKLYPEETQVATDISYTIHYEDIKALYEKIIMIRVLGENIVVKKTISIKNILLYSDGGGKRLLSPDDFGPASMY